MDQTWPVSKAELKPDQKKKKKQSQEILGWFTCDQSWPDWTSTYLFCLWLSFNWIESWSAESFDWIRGFWVTVFGHLILYFTNLMQQDDGSGDGLWKNAIERYKSVHQVIDQTWLPEWSNRHTWRSSHQSKVQYTNTPEIMLNKIANSKIYIHTHYYSHMTSFPHHPTSLN